MSSSIARRPRLNKAFFRSWEMILVYILVAINLLLMIFVGQVYFAQGSLQTIIRSGMEISIMVLGMTFILILGEIDVSVASIMILSCTVMGYCSGAGMPTFFVILFGVLAGGACGAINGLLVTKARMPSVIATIATSMFFRGIVHATLKNGYLESFPTFFSDIAWTDVGGFLPLSLIIFILFAILFMVVLHRTKFGRQLYIIGNNKRTANYSGIRVDRTKILAFVIMGMTAALSGCIFVGRLSGITYTMATGYELKVIAIVVLGGVSTLGGKGKLYGPVIATFIMAFLSKALDLLEVQTNAQKIATGLILIIAVLIPRINKGTILRFKLLFKRKNLRTVEGVDMVQNVLGAQRKITSGEKLMNKKEFMAFLKDFQITSEMIDYNYPKENVMKARRMYRTILRKYHKIPFWHRKERDDYEQTVVDAKDIYDLTLDRYYLKIDAIKAAKRARKLFIRVNASKRKEIVRNAYTQAIVNFKRRNIPYAKEADAASYVDAVNVGNWSFETRLTGAYLDQLQEKYHLSEKADRELNFTKFYFAKYEYYMARYYIKKYNWCVNKIKSYNRTLLLEAKKAEERKHAQK